MSRDQNKHTWIASRRARRGRSEMWGHSNCQVIRKSLQLWKSSSCTSQRVAVVRTFRGLHTRTRWVLHHHHQPKHRTTQLLGGQAHRTVRWYNQGGGAGGGKGGGSGKKPPEGSGGNFFQRLVENIRKEMKGSEVQENLKGFNEEREEMQQSYVVQQAKLKLNAALQKLGDSFSKGSETTSKGWSILRRTSTKVYEEAADTELAKKGHTIGSEFAKEVHKTASVVSQTDVGKAVKKGSEVVKEDLLDDIIKESSPYKAPEKMMKRSDLASDFSKHKTYKPNEETKDVVLTRQSKWKQQLKDWKENNPISNTMYNLKTRYDESDNLIIRASRVVTDKVEDAVSGVMTQSDMAETLADIHKIDPSFNKEEFVQQCKYEIIPSVLEAFMQGDEVVLKDWCYETAFSVLSVAMKQRHEPGVTLKCKVLEVRDIDIVMAKLLEQGPVMVLSFHAQQLTRKMAANSSVEDEILESVMYVWALCRDQTIYDPKTAWRVLEFGIQSAGKMLV